MATSAEAPATAGGLVPHTPFQFQPAAKENRPARIALDGPSGSGRTLSALRIGSALGERLAVIETEHGHAHRYADEVSFDSLVLSDFDPEHLFTALASAAVLAYDVVIVDCYSSFWHGVNGMREKVDADTRPGYGGANAAWHKHRPLDRRVTEALLAYPGHVLVTLRSDTETIIDVDAQGRQFARRVAVKPKQRPDLEYDFDVVGTLGPVATVHIGKSRVPELVDKVEPKPGAELGKTIRAWAEDGRSTGDWLEFVRRARDPQASSEDLRQLWREVSAARCWDMAVLDEFGQAVKLADLLFGRGQFLDMQQALTSEGAS
ncbi:AAA family ATPase [Streptomyces sp. NPDC001404]|uniref:AAA family ATPase n=1 Tax=Streptomyces sp. NPDC001404 TaxID=3364571 RepID=UPI0036AED4A3